MMLRFTKLLLLVILVYVVAMFFIVITSPGRELHVQNVENFDQSSTFLATENLNDTEPKISKQKPKKAVQTKPQPTPKTKSNATKASKALNKSKPKSKVIKAVRKSNPFSLLEAYPDPNPYIEDHDYDKPFYGLIHDEDYCNKVDLYNIAHPENMFEKMNFFTDFSKGRVMKKYVMSQIGTLFLNDVDFRMQKNLAYSRTYPIDKEITTFHTASYQFHKYHEIGKHFLCATQMFNHIPNHTVVIMKELFPASFRRYTLQYLDRPECLDENFFYPQTYRLFVEDECQEFFKIIHSEKYKEFLKTEPFQYLVKIGNADKAQGVFLLDKDQTKKLNSDFKKGMKCGQVKTNLVTQKYIANPLLLDKNNKFHMRVYLLITSTNPFIAYYHDGYLRASIFSFDKYSESRATHLTNLLMGDQVAEALNKNNVTEGKTAKQLEDEYIWSFEKLESYLLESGKTNDTKWLDNHLRPALQKSFVHVVRMVSPSLWKQSNVYQLLGCDFMMDDNMGVWFLEANANPLLDGPLPNMIITMLKDMFEIQYAYYRSRMKRVLDVIQKMKKDVGKRTAKKLEKWKKLYQEAVKNRLEPEYKINKKNSWKLIMDESLPGADAYFGLISKQCV